ncbi:peptidase M16 [Francisella halioticida]|uniref:Peptidase M16 n=1 Tax=Francisella halioticida TaxID=549298 RepID=A0ABM6LYU5_9GAMM|nr:pitrilysin family protein [Francisella halioticida]ASG67854.1 peptidase M16 [Francisella halioticida]BCD90667.1 peptidase M16 [Francisella halioticida]
MIQKFNIDNTPVYFQESQILPMLDIQINFRAGSAFDGKLNGLADLAVSMFATKTQTSNEQQLINKITDIGVSIHAETTKEFFNIKIRLLNDANIIDKTIKILHEIFTTPDFDQNILDREKIQTLTHINYLNQQPNYLASLEFSRNIFANNPYSHPVIGYENSVKDISSKDIADFFNKYTCASNANICIVGAVRSIQAKDISQQILDSLPKGTKNTAIFNQQENNTKVIKNTFNSKQTSILMGHQLLLNIQDPLYFPVKLGNEILGGSGLNSLLFNKVREELGLVYNISSDVNLNPDYGSFVISAQTSNPKLALDTIDDVYSNFIKNTIDDETIKNSKKHIEGTHLLSSVKNSSKLNMLSSIANKDLPLDFFDTYVENINNVTATQIHNSFLQIQQNNFITVMVGDV